MIRTLKVRSTSLTESLGLAGLEGPCYGFTTPSLSGESAIGIENSSWEPPSQFVQNEKGFWVVKV